MMKQVKASHKQKGPKEQAKRKNVAAPAVRNDSFNTYIEKNAFLLTSVLLTFVALFVFKDFIFLNKLMLYKDIGDDSINGIYPPLKHTVDYLHTVGFPMWSFNVGMGQNLLPFCLRDPFDIILYIAGKDAVAYGLGYLEFIKVITAGILFFMYLRTFSFAPFACMAGSLLYAFSGFIILGSGWYMFSFEAVNAALLLLAFERLYRNNSWTLFPVAVALIGISMPFNLYVYGLFLIIYAIFRHLDEKGWNTKSFLLLFSKISLLGLLGVGMSSLFLFSNILQLIESPRGSGGTSHFNELFSSPVFALSDSLQTITSAFRFFSNDLMGTGSNFKGWNNYLEAPLFYCGLISLLLFPLIFQFLDKRRKIIYGLFLAFWLLPVLFPFFRYAFWLFTGNYYRAFSFFVAFALLFFAINALSRICRSAKIKALPLVATILGLLIILWYASSEASDINKKLINKDIMAFTEVMIIIYGLLIWSLSMQSFRTIAQILILIALCIELGYSSFVTINNRSILTTKEFKSKIGYNDYGVDAVAYLKEHDKSFYRVDKNYPSSPAVHAGYNDAMVQDFRGSMCYSSFNQMYYIRFLQAIGIIPEGKDAEYRTRWADGLRDQLVPATIGNVKYIICKRGFRNLSADSIASFGDVNILKSRYSLPIGFTYDSYILRSDFDKMPARQQGRMIIKGFFIDDKEASDYNGFNVITSKDTVAVYSWDMYDRDLKNLALDTLALSDFGQNFFHGHITLQKKKLLFLSIPYDKGWTAKVDGKKQDIKVVDAGMSGLLLEPGTHTIELEFYPRYLKEGACLSVASLLLFGFVVWKRRK